MALGEVQMSSKRYPEEFKVEAVRQVVDRDHSAAEVASRLGVTTHSRVRLAVLAGTDFFTVEVTFTLMLDVYPTPSL